MRKLLQVACLEFWEVVEYTDPQIGAAFDNINKLLLKEQQAAAALKSSSEPASTNATAKPDSTVSALQKTLAPHPKILLATTWIRSPALNTSPIFALWSQNIPFSCTM